MKSTIKPRATASFTTPSECSFEKHKIIVYFLLLVSLSLHVSQFYISFNQNELKPLDDERTLDISHENSHERTKRNSKRPIREHADAKVEFIHPKLKDEMDTGDQDPNNPFVWLTSYSRIPLLAIQEFCSATKEYCPPGKEGKKGDAGQAGIPGLDGKRGRSGRPGPKGAEGHIGLIGPPGPRGPKGESGMPGQQGLDGRDGLPGEPGLDGVPGRNGHDGARGQDGTPGIPGSPGVPGRDGLNGAKGAQGAVGATGPSGERGLPGPRGKSGKDGDNGSPGEPGIGLWRVNGSNPDKTLIPPRISGVPYTTGDSAIIVKEGDNLKLTCAATGAPRPMISWNRQDGNAIPNGAWRVSNGLGSTLNITRINRLHMGTYVCEANNGIPPNALQKFEVQVHFPPLIRIHRQMVGGYNGSFTIMDCSIEAFPLAVHYWERHDGRVIQTRKDKYLVSTKDSDIYKTNLYLNISLSEPADFGTYYCISKNEKGLTKAAIELFERDPNSALPPPVIGGFSPTVIGQEPPEFVGLDDLCPPQPPCQDCKTMHALRCEGSARMYGLNILPYDSSFPGLPNRTQECVLENIGKPVFHRHSTDLYGSWMQDAYPREGEDGNKIWVTNSNESRILYEFINKTMFKDDVSTRSYNLPLPFTGNDHVIYNGSFFYLHLDSESIIKYDLNSGVHRVIKIPRNRIVRHSGLPLLSQLYQPQLKDNYLDISSDEDGVWAIMGMAVDNNTVVMKFDPNSLEIQFMWNISLSHHQVADMFIVCGVLYAVDHIDVRDSKIRFALDLYKNKLLDVELPFTNPFRMTTTLGYNPRLQSLTTWDWGNQLTYPVKYISIGYKEDSKDQEDDSRSTGFHVQSTKDSGLQVIDLPSRQDGN